MLLDLAPVEAAGLTVFDLNTYTLIDETVKDPSAIVDTFLFWNDVHPTAPVQALWAQGFEAAVPEPSTWAMLVVGFGSLGFAGYRRGARARTTA